jgi:tryptophan synthase alpha chain
LSEPRLAARWAELRRAGRAALIPYLTAGHPDRAATAAFLAGAEAAGADIVELGVPWSDPVADGATIQASSHAALRGGTTLDGVLALLAAHAAAAPPTVLFSYINPILAFGTRRFAAAARGAGAAGLLVVDLPYGADPGIEAELRTSGLPLVRLVAPTTPPDRLRAIAAASEGFVYLVARLGVTGARADLPPDLADRVAAARAASPLPVAVGFGIADPAQAAAVARLADGVVVGSALVERLDRAGAAQGLAWLAELRRAMDGARSAA